MIDTINRLKRETIPTVNNIRTMMQVNTMTHKIKNMIDKIKIDKIDMTT